MYNNRVDIWAMGCILYELATATRPFKTDFEVSFYVLSAKNTEIVFDDAFESDAETTITKYVVDMLQVDGTKRPSASELSKDFSHQLQIIRDLVQRSTVTGAVGLPAVIDEPKQTPPTPSCFAEVDFATKYTNGMQYLFQGFDERITGMRLALNEIYLGYLY